jgi:hypothetical protein
MDNKKKTEQRLGDDLPVAIPDELYREFRNMFDMIKEVQHNLHQLADAMRPIKDEK